MRKGPVDSVAVRKLRSDVQVGDTVRASRGGGVEGGDVMEGAVAGGGWQEGRGRLVGSRADVLLTSRRFAARQARLVGALSTRDVSGLRRQQLQMSGSVSAPCSTRVIDRP